MSNTAEKEKRKYEVRRIAELKYKLFRQDVKESVFFVCLVGAGLALAGAFYVVGSILGLGTFGGAEAANFDIAIGLLVILGELIYGYEIYKTWKAVRTVCGKKENTVEYYECQIKVRGMEEVK